MRTPSLLPLAHGAAVGRTTAPSATDPAAAGASPATSARARLTPLAAAADSELYEDLPIARRAAASLAGPARPPARAFDVGAAIEALRAEDNAPEAKLARGIAAHLDALDQKAVDRLIEHHLGRLGLGEPATRKALN